MPRWGSGLRIPGKGGIMVRSSIAFPIVLGLICVQAVGQGIGGFSSYPGGYLLMSYSITVEGKEYSYTIELQPTDGVYRVRTELSGPATLEELSGAPFLFVWNPVLWLGESWWLPYYYMLFIYGPVSLGRTYVLPGGLSFAAEEEVEIAGIRAVKGTITAPDKPDERVILALSPDPAVPYPVLVRQERKGPGGGWEATYEMVLVGYEHR